MLQKNELNLTTGPRGLLFNKRGLQEQEEERLFHIGKLLQKIGGCKFAQYFAKYDFTLSFPVDAPRAHRWSAM